MAGQYSPLLEKGVPLVPFFFFVEIVFLYNDEKSRKYTMSLTMSKAAGGGVVLQAAGSARKATPCLRGAGSRTHNLEPNTATTTLLPLPDLVGGRRDTTLVPRGVVT